MNIPEDVLWILQKLKDNGYPSYLVGGCVRDAYMGKEPKDWDITTPALPEQVKSIFRKTFDTGIQHGTVTVVINKNNYEITTFRIDGVYEKHRKPKEVFFTGDIIEDLSRRDFTINAIAYAPQQEYIDPFDGIADIDQKVIRAVGNPEDRFFEDALRMLRAIRFSAQFNFVIERNTFAALQKHAALIQNISYERIREELIKTITAEFVDRMIVLKETKILWTILPEVEKSFDEALHYLKQYKGEKKSVCLAILLANIQEDVVPILKRLTFDNHIVKRTQTILKYKDIGILTNAQMKKIILTIGQEAFIDLIDFIYVYRPLIADELKQQYNFIRNDCIFIKDLQIDGNDLVQLGFQKGPEIGRILSQLLYYVHENPSLNERSILLEMALEL